jgi:hypothetical protein
MPGPAMHHMIVERLMKGIIQYGRESGLNEEDHEALKALFSKPENMPYLYLGCQGPDFLFFATRDWPPGADTLARLYLDASDKLHEIKEDLKKAVPEPILDALEGIQDAGETLVDRSSTLTEVKELFEGINELLTGIVGLIKNVAADLVAGKYNAFDRVLSHPYRDGIDGDPNEWWLFDAMHYRKTGQFAKALLDATSLNDPRHLYALGYLSHVGADTVGHPFVNLFAGGPYRSHAQRHKVAENFHDVYIFGQQQMPLFSEKDLARSQLHARANFNFKGSLSKLNDDDEEPDKKTRLPDDLARLIADTINKIYSGADADKDGRGDFGAPTTADEIQTAYELWYRWWRNSTEAGAIPAPKPYSFSGELRQIWETAVENLEDVGDVVADGVNEVSGRGLLSIFPILAMLAIGAFLAAIALADAILATILTVNVATIRAAACLIYELVYNGWEKLRLGIALQGYGYPMWAHRDDPQLLQYKDPSIFDVKGDNATIGFNEMPLLRLAPSDSKEKHLTYPPRLPHGERQYAFAAPNSYLNREATWYAWDRTDLDVKLLDDLAAIGPDAPESAVKDVLWTKPPAGVAARERSLGNAVSLSGELYRRWRRGQPLPDFNLDADRGYGYPCWYQKGDPGPNTPNRLAVQPPEKGDQSDEAFKPILDNAWQQTIKIVFIGAGN